ncbi:hypothetical protein [Glaciibacter superstes]|uniref:hypothetical protein n=1 Tax=Glaciibacter superstes TaxID=501023 RepID=UPI00041A45AA|nr:hypothetical protein [Glaciibacter superstes]
MVWRKLLLTTAVLSLALSPALVSAAYASDGTCVGWGASQGECDDPGEATGNIGDGGVNVSVDFENGGGGGDSNGEGGGESDGDINIDGGGPGTSGNGTIDRPWYTINCEPGSPCDPNLVVRISDLVNFKAATPSQGMEPAGWAVVGLSTNFFAAASVHTVSSTLLGFPADVRFTPAGYHWNYGDGESSSLRDGGASWAALGLPEFSPTFTSHVYRSSGTRIITLDVQYTAEYRFAGQGWRNVQGSIAVPADPMNATAGDSKTVLVTRECTANPRGPGC